ncbi:uncharacterized protein LOC125536514 isoform X7 [Triticum urartu]|uniref:uncharacterized protein LOC125536514 isoform X7 n=1 Tax=Triticum urartu TaxID=4572 RepID=UPI0020447BA6|nr:uncharacterized protein LOC125536514 isoform X7 [Triticum urartu]
MELDTDFPQEFLPWSFPVQRTEFDTPNHKTTFNITTQGNFRKYFPVPGRNRTEDYTLQPIYNYSQQLQQLSAHHMGLAKNG